MVALTFAEEYQTAFTVTGPETEGRELLERVRILAQDWSGRMPGKPDGSGPVVESGESGDMAYHRFQLELPHASAPRFQMGLDFKLSTTGGLVAASVRSHFEQTGQESPPPNLLPGPPSLIWELLRGFDCYIGGDRLSWEPTVVTKETAEEFAHNRIFNPQRRSPIIAVSQDWRGHPPINPNWLQNRLVGLAEVATYNGDTAEELRRLVGFQLACYGGAIRIYQPGCSADDSRSQHQFWMPAQARALRSRPARSLLEEFISRFPDPATSREFENVRLQIQQKRLAEQEAEILILPLRQHIRDLELEMESMRQQVREQEIEAGAGKTEIRNLHQQLLELDSELEPLRQQLQQLIHREAEYKSEIARLHQQQAERDERIESLRQQLESAISQAGAGVSAVTQLHSQLLERDSQVEALWQELEKAAHREAEVEQEMSRLRELIQESDSEVEQMRQRLDDAAGEIDDSHQAVELLQSSLREREDERNALRSQLEDVQSRSVKSGSLIAELNEDLKIRDSGIANLRSLLEGVEEGTTDSDRIIAELRRELQEREDDAKAISALLEEARQRADAANNMVSELRRELELRPSELTDIGGIIQGSREDQAKAQTGVAATNRAIADLHRQIEVLNGEIAVLQRQLADAQREASNSTTDYLELLEQLEQKDSEIRILNYRIRNLQSLGQYEIESGIPLEEVNDVESAVVIADQQCNRLHFLNSAYETAERYPFQRAYAVFDAFSLLQDLAVARCQGPLGMSIEDWMKERGFDYAAHESEATMNMYGDTRRFGGFEMQEHIKIGSGTANKQHYIRIHFAWDAEEDRFIIGHIGEHLPTISG